MPSQTNPIHSTSSVSDSQHPPTYTIASSIREPQESRLPRAFANLEKSPQVKGGKGQGRERRRKGCGRGDRGPSSKT
eukprot:1388601-Amorphochlora_amoeboformis.AAC.2